jgi:hypothetical protein
MKSIHTLNIHPRSTSITAINLIRIKKMLSHSLLSATVFILACHEQSNPGKAIQSRNHLNLILV